MLIDCDSCTGRGLACGDCVVSVFLGTPALPDAPRGTLEPLRPAQTVDLDLDEAQALAVLADAGLVPPLRHVRPA
jgi:positive regulator of sigma E activity